MTTESNPLDLSKSYLFSVKNGALELAEQSSTRFLEPEDFSNVIVDKKFKLIALLGRGGMGEVYRAHHLLLDKDFALKTFASENISDVEFIRFQREAQSIAKLSHKNVVQVFDFGLSEDGIPYYTMEYLVGESLADRLKRSGALGIDTAIEFFIQICDGLSLAHSKGIIHRDLKPGNLFIEDDSVDELDRTIKIVDFGIASLTNQTQSAQRITTSGAVFGSPLYMSPEQSQGKPVNERSDIYSLGCTLFEALVGRPPFLGASATETIRMHHTSEAPKLSEATGGKYFPPDLEQTVATMLQKSPQDRQASAEQVALELSTVRNVVSADQTLRNYSQSSDPQEPAQQSATSTSIDTSIWKNRLLLVALTAVFLVVTSSFVLMLFRKDESKSLQLNRSPIEMVKMPNSLRRRIDASFKARTMIKDGQEYVQFLFPLNANMGGISGLYSDAPRRIIREHWYRVGDPKAESFSPSNEFLEKPENFHIFPETFLVGVRNCQIPENGASYIEAICRQRRLRALETKKSAITNKDLSALEKLKFLEYLGVDHSQVKGSELGKRSLIRKLDYLSFSDCPEADKLILKLKGSTKLQHLYSNYNQLTEDDCKTIATLENLTLLQLNNSGINDNGFAAFAKLKRLYGISAINCRITPQSIGTIKVMGKNGLKNLGLCSRGWSDQQMDSVRALLPNASFVDFKLGSVLQDLSNDSVELVGD